ncbi:hypothetical protein [Streptomyces gardneri]|uniref:hypothetical protein n=1 Tax=Streptomyces gardneri TaxID=66892 RepID=UPI0035E2A6DE
MIRISVLPECDITGIYHKLRSDDLSAEGLGEHALWDSMHGIALWLVLRMTAADLDRSLFTQGYIPQPTSQQEHLFTLFSVGGLALVTLVGLGWLRSLARREPDTHLIHTP